jgi:hypothetical protein
MYLSITAILPPPAGLPEQKRSLIIALSLLCRRNWCMIGDKKKKEEEEEAVES